MSIDKKSSYYDAGGIETINIICAKLTPEQFKGYLLGNVIKYSCRLNFKNDDGGKRDNEKIGHYQNLLQSHILCEPVFGKEDILKPNVPNFLPTEYDKDAS